jgi:hypothetical protein
MLTNFRFSPETSTIRSVPENYWVATVVDNKPLFVSWDGAIKGKICKPMIRILWAFGLITVTNGLSPYQIQELNKKQ